MIKSAPDPLGSYCYLLWSATNLEFVASQVKIIARLATAVPTVAMFPAVVQVQALSGITVNWHCPTAVALQPVGMLKPVTALVPAPTWNRGPLGVMAEAASATSVVTESSC